MKHEMIIFWGIIFISFLCYVMLVPIPKKISEPEEIIIPELEEITIPEYTQTANFSLMTTDAVPLRGTCTWHLNVPSTDVDRLKINLIIGRIMRESMIKYSYKDLLNNDVAIFKDIKERVEDCVFFIQPYGFTILSLSMNKPENVILK